MPGAECATTAYIKVGARREKAPGGRGGSTSGERKNGERKSGERTEKEIRNACTWRKTLRRPPKGQRPRERRCRPAGRMADRLGYSFPVKWTGWLGAGWY